MTSLNFTWNHNNPDNSPIVFRLYEDGEMIVDNIGQLNFSLLMNDKEFKTYSYYVTAFDTQTKLESVPSESVSVNFIVPEAPTGLNASFEE